MRIGILYSTDILINNKWRKYTGDSSKLQGDLNFAFEATIKKMFVGHLPTLPFWGWVGR
jgi:hypothetical protein